MRKALTILVFYVVCSLVVHEVLLYAKYPSAGLLLKPWLYGWWDKSVFTDLTLLVGLVGLTHLAYAVTRGRTRFTVRTLLATTTLVAALFGLRVWITG